MNSEDFQLRPLRAIRLDAKPLNAAIARLGKMTAGWEDGDGGSGFPDRVNDLRVRMKEGLAKGESFDDCTAVKRREATLLALYLNDLSMDKVRAWMPAFDSLIASSILGDTSEPLKIHLRRLATQLYFTHFGRERLPCLDWFSSVLRRSWSAETSETLDPAAKAWTEFANVLFAGDAPDRVAEHWDRKMSVEQLADRFHIHQRGLFRERLIESLILNRLRQASLDVNDKELCEAVVKEKERTLESGQRLGAAAVQILVHRAQKEKASRVPKPWCEQLVTFACDPRIPNSQEKYRWWGWSTKSELDVVFRALSELNLEKFIELLDKSLRGTPAEYQFAARKDLLLNLFRLGKVIDARLVLPSDRHDEMDQGTKNLLRPNWVKGGSQHTSFVCLRCSDDVYLIEGTHSFALRGFIDASSFPIQGFWDSDPKGFQDSQLRVDKLRCQIYQKHMGDWVNKVYWKLRRFNVEWRGIA
jgi:hypothetical protein